MSLKTKLVRAGSMALLWGKQHAPELLMGGGLLCFGGSIVLTAVRTPKALEVLDQAKTDLNVIESTAIITGTPGMETTEKSKEHDKRQVKAHAAMQLAKVYAPTVITATVGTFCILYAHGIMRKRYAALMAAYTTLEEAYSVYRNRIIDMYGEDVDYYARTGIKRDAIEEQVVDPETGKVKEVKHHDALPDQPSMYAKYFDDHSRQYKRDMAANVQFLRGEEKWFNHQLGDKGYVFLNDVYKALDIPEEPYGQVVGWIADPDVPMQTKLSFGITQGVRAAHRTDGHVSDMAILLDFNVDGPIWELLNNYDQGRKAAVTPGVLRPGPGNLPIDQKPFVDI